MNSLNNSHNKKDIILASQSERRIDILNDLKINFKSVPSNVEEPIFDNMDISPTDYALQCACMKAKNVADKVSNSLVIGMDTIGECKGVVFGKPRDREHAKQMIRALEGSTHKVITGICIMDSDSKESFTDIEITKVTFTKMSDNDIEKYLDVANWHDVAAGYAIQDAGALFIERIEGDYFNVVGFPIFRFNQLIKKTGMSVLELRNKY